MSPETDEVTWGAHGDLNFLEMLTAEKSAPDSRSDRSFQRKEVRAAGAPSPLSLQQGKGMSPGLPGGDGDEEDDSWHVPLRRAAEPGRGLGTCHLGG